MVNRISGAGSSGLDIEAVVTKLMKAEQAPLDKLNKSKQLIEWTRDSYKEVSTKLVDFRNNKLFSYNTMSAMSAKKTTVTGDTNAFTATALSSDASGSFTVKVNQLATGGALVSGTGIGATTATTTLADIGITNASTIQINGQSISFNSTDTISSFVSKINKNSSANVVAVFDSTSGKLSLTSKTTGLASSVTVSNDLKTAFKLDTLKPGTNAKLTVNGLDIEQDSNSYTLNDVKLTFNAVSTSVDGSTVTVSSDTDAIVNTIKSFISDYNNVLSLVNNKLDEARYSSYGPLTSDEKSAMTDGQITAWEAKAKSGLIRRDSTLTSLVSNLRLSAISSVNVPSGSTTSSMNITEIGITTGTWSEGGKLYLDETKLRKAIEANPDQVVALFTGKDSSVTSTSNPITANNGVFNRMYSVLKTGLDGLAEKAGTSKYSVELDQTLDNNSTLGSQVRGIDDRIATMQDRLNRLETAYYAKFTAMESAISKLNSQASNFS
ncbi:flagellar filament capping protein FliD [Paenibacillus sp. CGMCC 1.16610]|uniref:Flagellar hook-associated protein 2 n=1 Tax=Paenibacillus anseongense TaxID=2682845 RepID=A0ABW9U502_9BACL|nr:MULTISPECIES: flagellar filament capping protein FliD [Paenibacillus]MBA2942403.1 flagellar filament capping protein FliD [Paenibacillus sp. CGMCC 1.16610]MVQ34478.1 flagellar filament capping protein FliD [Paenibacillus anseongense]